MPSLLPLLKRLGIVYAALAILLLLASAIVSRLPDPARSIAVPAYLLLFLGAFVCGYLSCRGGSLFPDAPIAAAIYLLPILLLSFFFGGAEHDLFWRAILYVAAAAMVIAGGLAAIYRRPKKISPDRSRAQLRKKYLTQKRAS